MLFITNRKPQEAFRGTLAPGSERPYQFELDDNSPETSVYYCRRDANGQYMEIGSTALMSQLQHSEAKQILLFIHGFSNLPEPNIFPRAAKLQAYFDLKEPNLVQVVPLIWPCDNDAGILKDYWDDQKAADGSAFAFARVLQKFMGWRENQPDDDPCTKRINMLAHSMGNRVLRETLVKWDKYDLASGVPLLFRNTILMAADIVNESLEFGRPGQLICQSSRNVSVYFASDDLALRASKASNLKNKVASRRLGHTGPEQMGKVPGNVYTIDCDNFNNQYDSPKGHSYFLADADGGIGKVFEHLFQSIKHGRVQLPEPGKREIVL